jgi:hypothetical protein
MAKGKFHMELLDPPALCRQGKIDATQPTMSGRRWSSTLKPNFVFGDVGKAQLSTLVGEFPDKIHRVEYVGSNRNDVKLISVTGLPPDNWGRIVYEFRRRLAEKLSEQPISGRRGQQQETRKRCAPNSPFHNALSRSSKE